MEVCNINFCCFIACFSTNARDVMADFEEAPASAVRQAFANDVMVSGCSWFHYAQALVKRLRKIGLVQQSPGDADDLLCFVGVTAAADG